jgi:hypothetical protein
LRGRRRGRALVRAHAKTVKQQLFLHLRPLVPPRLLVTTPSTPRTTAARGRGLNRLIGCLIVGLNVFSLSIIAIVMRQRLYTFGLKHQNTDRPSAQFSALEPAPILEAASVRVLWAAWCDAVIAYSHIGNRNGDGGEEPWPWVLKYMGTGLTTAQKELLTGDTDLKRGDGPAEAVFFGSAMHNGLRGYVVKSGDEDADTGTGVVRADRKIVLFGTDLEMDDDGVPDVQSFLLTETEASITDVKINSEGCVLLYTKSRSAIGESVMRFADFAHFRRHLSSGSIDTASEVVPLPYESHSPPQYVSNATTTTAVDDGMHVWTSTRDPRYPKCLGRSYEGGEDIAPLPYLSESYVTKIASGGYMSAAVSSDGELFLWGQACPGSEKELDVLKGSRGVEGLVTGVDVHGQQDGFVKCLDMRIDGQEARVCDVAVGHGHVLVAAESCRVKEETKSVLFAAGDNSKSQLGLETDTEFKETFGEVASLRGKRVVQLVAAGWSTYVVTHEE